ncbi:MAG: site-2 protease family protein [Candidatus Micrarchaeaceae archaeon]
MSGYSPKIGKIDGIDIELHWTFLLLLVVILVLSLYLFVVWLLLFACVLVHELFHSITSKRNGIKVKKIVLYPFGGGSMIDFENVSPEIEFRISLVGPIASLLIAALFGILNIYTPSGIIGTTVQILFLLNIFLGVFNLLPWLPLDGGRALRSYLQKTKNFLDATKAAVKSSNVVTVLFVAGTVLYVVFVHGYSVLYKEFIVLWDVAIAFFIYSGAKAELQSAYIKQNISDLKAQDAMTKNYVVAKMTSDTSDLYDILTKSSTNIILFKNGRNVEALSNSSLQRLLKTQPHGTTGSFGTKIPSVQYNTSLYSAIERMRSAESNMAAVTKHGRICGVLLMQHVESIVALHISRNGAAIKQTNK